MTETYPESLRRYVVLAVLQYEEELKKRDARIVELENELSEYKCVTCTTPISDKYDAVCTICQHFVCDDCYDHKIVGMPFKCKNCV